MLLMSMVKLGNFKNFVVFDEELFVIEVNIYPIKKFDRCKNSHIFYFQFLCFCISILRQSLI